MASPVGLPGGDRQRWLSRETEGCPCRASLEGEQCVEGGGAVKGHMPEGEGPGTAKSSQPGLSPTLSPHSFLPSLLPSPFTEHHQRPKHAQGVRDKIEKRPAVSGLVVLPA